MARQKKSKASEGRPAPPTATAELLPVPVTILPGGLVRPDKGDSLAAWVRLYGSLEAAANAVNTFKAKGRDLELFMAFFTQKMRSDHPDDWVKVVTTEFLKDLERVERMKPTSVNRVLATLRHCATWIHKQRPFLAGNPTAGVKELTVDEPEWKGLSDVEVMRLKSASEQLVVLKVRKNQRPLRDRASFLVLLNTGLRISELLGLQLDQYAGKSFRDVKRKGKVRTSRVIVPTEARAALDLYIETERGPEDGPIFQSRKGQRLERQHVDRLLKQLAAQANSKLPECEKIDLSAHVLRHTFLRKLAEKEGVQHAMKASGHSSSKYIWRYVNPSEAQEEKALENLW